MLPILSLHLSSRPGSPQPSLEPTAPCWGLWGGIDPECIQYVMGTQASCSLAGLGRQQTTQVLSSCMCCGCFKSKPQQVEELKPDFQVPSSSLPAMPTSMVSRVVLRMEGTQPGGKRHEKEENSQLMDLLRASRGCCSSSRCCDVPWEAAW